jgi:MoaD family protein
MVEIKYWGGMMELAGKKGEAVDARDLSGVMSHIQRAYGKAGLKEAKRMLIVVNGTNIQMLNRFKTPLNDGDTVAFLPLCTGG